MGSRAFLLYYLYCGIGAAVLRARALGRPAERGVPFVGASGAVLGVAVAFALLWPDAELLVFPLPMPIKARTLHRWSWSGSTSSFSLLLPNDGVAHLAHVGGAAFGYLFFRLQALSRRSPHPPPRAGRAGGDGAVGLRRARAAHAAVAACGHAAAADADPVAAEVDRVLDKISERASRASPPPSGASSTRCRGRRSRQKTRRAIVVREQPSCAVLALASSVSTRISYLSPC